MKTVFKSLIIYISICLAVGGMIYSAARYLGDQTLHVAKKQWNPANAADQGFNSHRLQRAVEYIDARLPTARGLIIIKNGKTVLEKYYWKGGPLESDYLHSLNACVLEALVGIAIDEQLLSDPEQALSDFFPEYFGQELGQDIPDLTIDDLLQVQAPLIWGDETVEFWELFYAKDKIAAAIAVLDPRNEASHPAANFAANLLLSKIIHRVSTMDVFEFADSRLLAPMGISTYSEREKDKGLLNDFVGFKLKTLDLAKLGFLILNKGGWQANQLLPEAWSQKILERLWIDSSTTVRGSWQLEMIDSVKSYVCQGEGGQFIVISPELDLVIAISSKSRFPLLQISGYRPLFELIIKAARDVASPDQSINVTYNQTEERYFAPNLIFATNVPKDIQEFFNDFARSIATNDIKRVAHHYVKGYQQIDDKYIINTKVSAYEFWWKIFNGGSGELQSVQINKIRIDKNRAYLRGLIKYSYANMNEGSVGWFPLENLMKIRGRWHWVSPPASAEILDRDEYFDAETPADVKGFIDDCSGAFIGPQLENKRCFSEGFLYDGLTELKFSEMLKTYFKNHKVKLHFTSMEQGYEDRFVDGYFEDSLIGDLPLPPKMKIVKESGQWKWLGNGR